VNGGHNISMGYQSAKGLNGGSNAVIGFQAGMGVEGSNNIILGTNATSKSIIPGNLKVQNVVSLGTNSKATTDNSVSIGAYSEAKGRAAIAIGQNSNASKDNSMAIGNRTSVNAVKDVAIGSDSSTSATTGVSKATITVPGTGALLMELLQEVILMLHFQLDRLEEKDKFKMLQRDEFHQQAQMQLMVRNCMQ